MVLPKIRIKSFVVNRNDNIKTDANTVKTGDGGYVWVGEKIGVFPVCLTVVKRDSGESVSAPGCDNLGASLNDCEHNHIEESQGNLIFKTCLDCGEVEVYDIETGLRA